MHHTSTNKAHMRIYIRTYHTGSPTHSVTHTKDIHTFAHTHHIKKNLAIITPHTQTKKHNFKHNTHIPFKKLDKPCSNNNSYNQTKINHLVPARLHQLGHCVWNLVINGRPSSLNRNELTITFPGSILVRRTVFHTLYDFPQHEAKAIPSR